MSKNYKGYGSAHYSNPTWASFLLTKADHNADVHSIVAALVAQETSTLSALVPKETEVPVQSESANVGEVMTYAGLVPSMKETPAVVAPVHWVPTTPDVVAGEEERTEAAIRVVARYFVAMNWGTSASVEKRVTQYIEFFSSQAEKSTFADHMRNLKRGIYRANEWNNEVRWALKGHPFLTGPEAVAPVPGEWRPKHPDANKEELTTKAAAAVLARALVARQYEDLNSPQVLDRVVQYTDYFLDHKAEFREQMIAWKRQFCTPEAKWPEWFKYSITGHIPLFIPPVPEPGEVWTSHDYMSRLKFQTLGGVAETYYQYRTQKARGVRMLACRGAVRADIIQDESTLREMRLPPEGLFVRPCPTRPRHGFVDSRVVKRSDDLMKLWREARVADPDAEMIVMSFIRAKANAVITDRLIRIGPGHDGATSGKECLNIALAGLDLKWTAPVIALGDAPFLEAVFSRDDTVHLVQVRGGPADLVAAGDWVPKTVTVKKVLLAEGDLLEWEAKTAEVGIEDGTVIWSPNGSMLSHYAVHARLHGLPVVLGTTPPAVGSTLEATASASAPVVYDREAFRQGCHEGAWLRLPNREDWAKIVEQITFSCHHGPSWGGTAMSRLLGRMAVLFVRIGYAASIGEFRHVAAGLNEHARDQIYEKALLPGMILQPTTRKLAGGALWAFANATWKGGYGGKKWYKCLEAAVAIEDAVRAVVGGGGKKGRGGIKTVLLALNRAINLAHNNGWWLNKFVQGSVFDKMARGEVNVTTAAAFSLWEWSLKPAEIPDPAPTGWIEDRIEESALSALETVRMRGEIFGVKPDAVANVEPKKKKALPPPKAEPCKCYLCTGTEEPAAAPSPVPAPTDVMSLAEAFAKKKKETQGPPYVPVPGSRIQADLRISILHVQAGVMNSYSKRDVYLPPELIDLWNGSKVSRKAYTSLADTSTVYYGIDADEPGGIGKVIRASLGMLPLAGEVEETAVASVEGPKPEDEIEAVKNAVAQMVSGGGGTTEIAELTAEIEELKVDLAKAVETVKAVDVMKKAAAGLAVAAAPAPKSKDFDAALEDVMESMKKVKDEATKAYKAKAGLNP